MLNWWTILEGDIKRLREIPDASVNCVVTSPPYWQLRDYGFAGQLGMEETPQAYLRAMVRVFREVRRTLRPDGTCWVNMGDSYVANPGQRKVGDKAGAKSASNKGSVGVPSRVAEGLKAKDLVGMPWRLALELQADGWYLRRDIIWSKPNPMPESCKDRPTTAHEYIFLLTKSARYWYDWKAGAEACSPNTHARMAQDVESQRGSERANGGTKTNGTMKAVCYGVNPKAAGATGARQNASMSEAISVNVVTIRNRRSVWSVAPQAFKGNHYATFPLELVRPMIRMGCPAGGIVLDPFAGTMTTAIVALQEGRNAIGIEGSPAYCKLARRRMAENASLFVEERPTLLL